jgi:hypothetical protein
MLAARMAYLFRGQQWVHMKAADFNTHMSIDFFCSHFSDQLERVQVFDADNKLLLDRTIHPILDEVT